MPKATISNPELKPGRTNLFVLSEKGGVRKTATALRIAAVAMEAGCAFHIVQVDDQSRVEQLYPGHVTTIKLPSAEAVRRDELAEARALDPLLARLLDTPDGIVIVDVGANFDARVMEFLAGMDYPTESAEAGIANIAIVPMTTEQDAVMLGVRSIRRFDACFPGSRLIVARCQDGGDFGSLQIQAQQAFDEFVKPRIADPNNVIDLAFLRPRSRQTLERLGCTAEQLASMPPRELEARTGLLRAETRQILFDLSECLDAIDTEVTRALGPFRSAAAG
jgi:hypothetical protein